MNNTSKTNNQSTNSNSSNKRNNITDIRQSESPARTIDSHDSTTGSLDTIVDRSLNREEMLQATTIEQSVNTTNMQNQQQQQHDSLTNSQIAMLHASSHSSGDEDANAQIRRQQQQQQQQQRQQQHQHSTTQTHSDAQSHIYSSPVYDQKPPLQISAATLLSAISDEKNNAVDDEKKPKLITHEEFQKQLQQVVASRANTFDSRISKKQRFPPELIKIKDDGDGSSSLRSSLKKGSRHQRNEMSSVSCCSAFPLQIVLGTLQLVLAISLVALGSLLIVREAALSTAGCGIWSGLIAAITGSLGVISIRKTQTAFLALSLISIATSTLALAISGVGLSRDIYRMEEELDLFNASGEISAASSLIFALFLHFVVSIVSVYRCALQLCGSSQHSDLRDVVVKSNSSGLALDQEKIDQYIKAMSLTGSEKENSEKLAAMWMYATHMGSLPPPSVRKITPPSRPIMLIPARASSTSMLATPPPPHSIGLPPPMMYRGMHIPPMHPGSLVYAGYHPSTGSIPGTYRTQKTSRSTGGDIQTQRRQRRRLAAQLRSGKMDANKRQRRKSDADVLDGKTFQYTGLDRTIADSFLAQQAQSNAGSQIDYTSSSSASDTYGKGNRPSASSRASSKTKIICRDVVM